MRQDDGDAGIEHLKCVELAWAVGSYLILRESRLELKLYKELTSICTSKGICGEDGDVEFPVNFNLHRLKTLELRKVVRIYLAKSNTAFTSSTTGLPPPKKTQATPRSTLVFLNLATSASWHKLTSCSETV